MKNHFRKLISKLTSDPWLLSERSVLNSPEPWLVTKSFHVGSICRTTYRFLENLNLKLISNIKICGSGDLSPLRAGIAGGGNLAPTPHTLVSIPNFKNKKFKNLFFEIQILNIYIFMILYLQSPEFMVLWGRVRQTTTAGRKLFRKLLHSSSQKLLLL